MKQDNIGRPYFYNPISYAVVSLYKTGESCNTPENLHSGRQMARTNMECYACMFTLSTSFSEGF